jgi:hemolysin activation/secretion protein
VFGNTYAHLVGWNYLFSRSQTSKSGIDLTLSVRRTEREVNNLQLTPQRLSVLRVAGNRLSRFVAGEGRGYWTIELGVSRGLNAFAASDDAPELQREDAHSQFTKLDVSASLAVPIGFGWNYRGSTTGQWSRVALFSSEQIYIGGVASVRGFRESSVSGDRGGYLRNELYWQRAQPLQWFGDPLILQPYLFLDAGSVELIAQHHWISLTGVGIGLRAQWLTGKQQWSADATIGRPLTQPTELGNRPTVVQASLNWIL